MSWLTVAWSVSATACAMLGLLHALIWVKQRPGKVYLVSSLMAFAAAANAMAELGLMHIFSVERYVSMLKFENLAVAVMLISMVWFVDLHLKTARRWLTITITVIWIIALIVNFQSPASLVFAEISELKRLTTFWGENFTIGLGANNPWKSLADAASIFITIHAIDASIKAWRTGHRDHALLVGGSIAFFIVAAGIHTPLVDAGIVATPYMVSFAFLAIVLALSYDLVNEVVKVPRFTRELEETRREMDRIVRANILGELSSSLAHELNQPLAAILSNAQAAQRLVANDFPKAEALREILEDIVRDDKRAGEVIRRLRRMLSRGEVQRERFSINTALNESIKLMRSELEASKFDLHVTQDKTLPMVDASRVEIQQVIMNLMLNAMRAMDRLPFDKREINLQTGLANGAVRFTIEDAGPGVTADNIDSIFEPFYSTGSGGLGMGLAICRRIIENYGGRIQAENLEHGGARFWFTLPAAGDVNQQ